MKFLGSGDSVIAMRFIYNAGPDSMSGIENTESAELTFDSVAEIQDAMDKLFPNGDMPFSLQEDIIDLDAVRAAGDYTQADMTNQLSNFQNNLNAALSSRGQYPDISSFMDAVQEFMGSRAIDLSEFRSEASDLMRSVQETAAQSVNIDNRLAILEDRITADYILDEINNPKGTGESVFTVASTAGSLSADLDTARDTAASILAELDDTSIISGSSLAAGLASAEALA